MTVPLPTVHIYDKAWDEIREDLRAPFLSRIADAFVRELHKTGGSRLKRLRGPYHGAAFRVRWGKLRAPVSWVREWQGASHLFVHQCAERDEVYESEQFRERLDHFHTDIWGGRHGQFRRAPDRASYTDVSEWLTPVEASNSDDHRIELLPSPEQSRVLRQMLPFPGTWAPKHAAVVLAHGPPGSGKTVLAMEAARVAAEGDATDAAYSVLLLVPSPRLFRLYQDALQECDVPVGTCDDAHDGSPQKVTLVLADRFFAVFSGMETDERERDALLYQWWRSTLDTSRMKAWANEHPEVRERRFLQLIDATLEDPQGLGENRKDPLDVHDQDRYALVSEFRSKGRWMSEARTERSRLNLLLRSEIADRCLDALAPKQGRKGLRALGGRDVWAGRLLILVDEAQDLIPAEWSALLEWATVRRTLGQSRPTRIALLGDENQRISPTSFSWNEVNRKCADTLHLDPAIVCKVTLPGSFRLGRAVAAAANEVFHESVSIKSKFREVACADPSLLSDIGAISVVVVPDAATKVLEVLGRVGTFRQADARLQVVLDESRIVGTPDDVGDWLDLIPPRLVKGLEFPRLVVVEPFGGQGTRLSFDAAAVAYTSLTRAAEDLAVVLTPAEWGLVESRWRLCGVEPTVLAIEHSVDQELIGALSRLLGEVDIETRIQVVLARLRDDVGKIPVSGGSKQEAAEQLKRITGSASFLFRVGRIEDLAAECSGIAAKNAWLGEVARQMVAESEEDPEVCISLLIMLGETAAAADLGERLGAGDAAARAALETLATTDGSYERAVRLVRRAIHSRPAVASDTLMALPLAAQCAARIRQAPLPSLAG